MSYEFDETVVSLDYTNYKGERKIYNITPVEIRYDLNNEYHGTGFVLRGNISKPKDSKDGLPREFALKDIHNPEVLEGLFFLPMR